MSGHKQNVHQVLALNVGSATVKYRLFQMTDIRLLAWGMAAQHGEQEGWLEHWVCDPSAQMVRQPLPLPYSATVAVSQILKVLLESQALSVTDPHVVVGHRVVHGGEYYAHAVAIDDTVLGHIRSLAALAPLHQPTQIAAIEISQQVLPQATQVAVFDTAFHHTLPPHAFRYPLPEWAYQQQGVRRYGFHGISHAFVSREAATHMGVALSHTHLISLHLGNGASVAAIAGGRCVETSMGMTPLAGLMMGSRCGDVDPGAVLHLMRTTARTPTQMETLLSHESGFKGLCGESDVRQVHTRAQGGDPQAQLALEIYVHRIKQYIGAYYAVLGRVTALVFTGGIGEHDAWVRARVCEGLEALGIVVDAQRNVQIPPDADATAIHDTHSLVQVWVIPTNEELEIARQAMAVLATS